MSIPILPPCSFSGRQGDRQVFRDHNVSKDCLSPYHAPTAHVGIHPIFENRSVMYHAHNVMKN